jgi:hypothetical protein
VADHNLAVQAHAGVDVPRLAVAVGRLVQVHEVHIDRAPRQMPTPLVVPEAVVHVLLLVLS